MTIEGEEVNKEALDERRGKRQKVSVIGLAGLGKDSVLTTEILYVA